MISSITVTYDCYIEPLVNKFLFFVVVTFFLKYIGRTPGYTFLGSIHENLCMEL